MMHPVGRGAIIVSSAHTSLLLQGLGSMNLIGTAQLLHAANTLATIGGARLQLMLAGLHQLANGGGAWSAPPAGEPTLSWLWALMQLEMLERAQDVRHIGALERLATDARRVGAVNGLAGAGKVGHDTGAGGFI